MTSCLRGAVAGLLALAAAGCGGGANGVPASARSSSPPPTPGAYNADQLSQALLTDLPGYERSGAPQLGQYGSLAAVQNAAQTQQTVRIDKPRCASPVRAVAQDKALQTAPSALVTFVRGSRQSVTETLMAVGPDTAARQVGVRVPAGCRAFHVKVGGRWTPATVTETHGARIGEGSRTVGLTTTTDGTTVRTWFVVLRSRGYLATVALYGPAAGRGEAERIAERAYQQAERILP